MQPDPGGMECIYDKARPCSVIQADKLVCTQISETHSTNNKMVVSTDFLGIQPVKHARPQALTVNKTGNQLCVGFEGYGTYTHTVASSQSNDKHTCNQDVLLT